MILVDTSALGKILVDEPESDAVRAAFRRHEQAGDVLAISTLATTELRRLAIRLGISAERVEPILAPFQVFRLSEGILQLAGRFPHRQLGTLDAIHLATALTVEADAIVTYDVRLADSARAEHLDVLHPGRE